jgi:pimeloyl-ACP methyl ester carboxylesterase
VTGVTPSAHRDGLAVYESPAAGERVLWIHGYTLDSTIWGPLWSVLPEWHHVAADLVGHGRSRPMDPHDTIATVAATLIELAAAYDVRHVVGLSLGSMIATQIAIMAPGGFASVVLGSPALADGPADPDAVTKSLQLTGAYREHGASALPALWMQWPPDIFKGAADHPALWDSLVEVVARHSWAELAGKQMERFTRVDQVSRLTAIVCPTLVVVGEDDMPAFKRTAELLRRSLPKCTRVYMSNAGHLGLLEHPAAAAPLLRYHWQAS